jgi:glycosyltransferase involved in cell wall biosynthesis
VNQHKNILYLSYDGMTDPLGQSQVLPYIIGLTKEGYHFTLISCEKKERYQQNQFIIENICTQNNIDWQPIFYTKKPPILSTIWDIYQINKKTKQLHQQQNFSLIHCRSYITALIGLGFKQKHGVKFLFDMRGFWADERVDGKIWDISKPHYKKVYNFFKRKERSFLSDADAVVSLTNNGKQEMLGWNIPQLNSDKISVIPCVADYNHFTIIDETTATKSALGIAPSTKVMSYIGSLGTWYLADEMVLFYKEFKTQYPDSVFLVLTPEPPEIIHNLAKKHHLKPSDFVIRFSTRKELPQLASIADFSIFFIKNSYSKKSSSPTKMGELLAMGIPVICNNIGDVKTITEQTNTGFCLEELNAESFREVIAKIDTLFHKTKKEIRENSQDYFLLEKGLASYSKIYKTVLNNEK